MALADSIGIGARGAALADSAPGGSQSVALLASQPSAGDAAARRQVRDLVALREPGEDSLPHCPAATGVKHPVANEVWDQHITSIGVGKSKASFQSRVNGVQAGNIVRRVNCVQVDYGSRCRGLCL